MAKLFERFSVKGMELRNRVVMPPMCMYSAPESRLTQWHEAHYAARAVGGAGLIIMEATGVAPEGRLSASCLGLWEDAQGEALAGLVRFAQGAGARIAVQLNHGGRKCEVPGAAVEAPSALPYDEGWPVPSEMSLADIRETVGQFAAAAGRAARAGFDAIELHGAHGYLINQFLSPLTNRRTDGYGGAPENRARFLGEVLEAVGAAWPKGKPVILRVSAEEYDEGGNHPQDVARMINHVKGAGCGIDVVHVSTGGLTPAAPPKVFPGYQLPQAREVRAATGLPVIGGGLVTAPQEAEAAVTDGGCDLVFLGRELLRDPYWPLHASVALGAGMDWPPQYERARPRAHA
jgi:NADPH2 dehydrogenase